MKWSWSRVVLFCLWGLGARFLDQPSLDGPSKRRGLKLQGFLLMIWPQMSLNFISVASLWLSEPLSLFSSKSTGSDTAYLHGGGGGDRIKIVSVTFSKSLNRVCLRRKPLYQMGRKSMADTNILAPRPCISTGTSKESHILLARCFRNCTNPMGLFTRTFKVASWDKKALGGRNEFCPEFFTPTPTKSSCKATLCHLEDEY